MRWLMSELEQCLIIFLGCNGADSERQKQQENEEKETRGALCTAEGKFTNLVTEKLYSSKLLNNLFW